MEHNNEYHALFEESYIPPHSVLTELVYGFVQIDRRRGAVLLTLQTIKLSIEKQILLYMIGRYAAQALGIIQYYEASPAEITKSLRLNGNSVRPNLTRLRDSGVLGVAQGTYRIRDWNKAIDILRKIAT